MATVITRHFKQLLRSLPSARGLRRAKSAPVAAKPQVLGVGLGSAFFPRAGSDG
ncbi:hypothetical protein AB0H86_39090 [Streptomyces sp. NPDC050997]|uniref:hypothetical protein n=1 Tax=Streptomyces sp. NPDC050997 TaxID=3155519 RepID=UPI0034128AEF